MFQFENRRCVLCSQIVRLDKPYYVDEKTKRPVHISCGNAEANCGKCKILKGQKNFIPLIAMGVASAAPVVAEHLGKAFKKKGKKSSNTKEPPLPDGASEEPMPKLEDGNCYYCGDRSFIRWNDGILRCVAYGHPVDEQKSSNKKYTYGGRVSKEKPEYCPLCGKQIHMRYPGPDKKTICSDCFRKLHPEKNSNKISDYDEWWGDIVHEVEQLIGVTTSDAQGIVEGQEFHTQQSWTKGLSAKETAKIIKEKSSKSSNPRMVARGVAYIPTQTRAEAQGVIAGLKKAGFKTIQIKPEGGRFRAYYYTMCRPQKNFIHESITPKDWYEEFRTVRVDGHVVTVGYSGYDPKSKKHAISELHSILHPKTERAPCRVRSRFGEKWTTRRENITKGGAQRIAAHGRAQGKRARVMPIGKDDYDAFIDGHRLREENPDYTVSVFSKEGGYPEQWVTAGSYKTKALAEQKARELRKRGGEVVVTKAPVANMAQSTSQMTAEAIRKRGYRARSIPVAKGDYQVFHGGKRKVRAKTRIKKPIRKPAAAKVSRPPRAAKPRAAPTAVPAAKPIEIPTTPVLMPSPPPSVPKPIAPVGAVEKPKMTDEEMIAKIKEQIGQLIK